MQIQPITDKNLWNSWLLSATAPFNPFTQSWQWGEVLVAEGKNIERLGIFKDKNLAAIAQIIYQKAGNWLYAFCPQGPNIDRKYADQIDEIYQSINQYLKTKNCIFFRIEPRADKFIPKNARRVLDINPSATSLLDLTQPEETIVQNLHKKTRYSLRLAEKNSLQITFEKNLEIFWQLTQATAKRGGFTQHPKKHYEKILANENSTQINAAKDGQIIATAIFFQFGKTFTYLFAAAADAHRDLMGPYLIQMAAIRYAQKQSCAVYDFFGIAPPSKPISKNSEYEYNHRHSYAGFTKFKLGFSGKITIWPGTFDIIISPARYHLYSLLRFIRRLF